MFIESEASLVNTSPEDMEINNFFRCKMLLKMLRNAIGLVGIVVVLLGNFCCSSSTNLYSCFFAKNDTASVQTVYLFKDDGTGTLQKIDSLDVLRVSFENSFVVVNDQLLWGYLTHDVRSNEFVLSVSTYKIQGDTLLYFDVQNLKSFSDPDCQLSFDGSSLVLSCRDSVSRFNILE